MLETKLVASVSNSLYCIRAYVQVYRNEKAKKKRDRHEGRAGQTPRTISLHQTKNNYFH
ncbi:hypothetical protein HanXRQr2_Chr16g0736421 [Helianthus annuus]|uniref:Uncharacterized protein n=1 Tax=Helianthus annuus TaxID=4232 RepID=A0A9K3GXV3_HELAN|nr:hypothetical protein HanXRQr2_Chr16g0736421 [Helianthus annuus]